jgi:DNA-binding CsgD family transcriptional regulator
LAIQLASTYYPVQLDDYQYALTYKEGQPYWSPIPKDGNIRFQALQTGNYQVLLRHNAQLKVSNLLSFEIFPPWYASWPGGLMYLGFTFLSYYLIVLYQRQKAKKVQERLLKEKEREIEKERILTKNNELEREVNYKSQMLANSTMTLIQKNKMLNELKSYIEEELKQTKHISKTKNRLMHLINRNINNDEDWQIFENNFNQIHQAFMERLVNDFEELSPQDLKLAAYIRIGLQSKEIAPLMNISSRSVENNRSRLRKKIKLTSTDNLKEFLLHY